MTSPVSRPAVPAGACDCHMHIYDARYPAATGAALRPPDARVADYVAMQAALGLSRCVVVTPSTYGDDNRITLDALVALRQAGIEARGVAVVAPTVDTATLRHLDAQGVRAIRFNQTRGGVTSIDDLETLAGRVAGFGWHIELLLPAQALVALAPRLSALPVPIVFDHFGRLPSPGAEHPGHRVVLDLLEAGRAWVKLSGAYLGSPLHEERFPDVGRMARAYLAVAPKRVVWGSNWPHPTATLGLHHAPSDAELLSLLVEWCSDAAGPDENAPLQRVLVDNPAALYRF